MPAHARNRSALTLAVTRQRWPKGRRWLPAAATLLAAFLLIRFAILDGADLELSFGTLERVRDRIRGFGWLAPAVFVVLVAFRPLLLLSSHVVLALGGVAFGAWAGTVWGALGLFLSATCQFGAARLLGDAWVEPWLGARGLAVRKLLRSGPWLVGLVTAHPFGVMTPVHLAAGLVGMPVGAFATAVALAAPVRAGIYAALGASVLEWELTTSLALAGGLGALTLAPLAHPTVRGWVFAADQDRKGPK